MHHNKENILEYAKISKLVYDEKKEDDFFGSDKFKFYAKVFEKKGEVIVAFRGTKLSDRNDLQNDLQIFFKQMPSRVNQAKEYVEGVQEHYNKKEVVYFVVGICALKLLVIP